MEKKHKERLQEKFSELLECKLPIVHDIPDEYQYMDAELIETLKLSVQPLLDNKL